MGKNNIIKYSRNFTTLASIAAASEVVDFYCGCLGFRKTAVVVFSTLILYYNGAYLANT